MRDSDEQGGSGPISKDLEPVADYFLICLSVRIHYPARPVRVREWDGDSASTFHRARWSLIAEKQKAKALGEGEGEPEPAGAGGPEEQEEVGLTMLRL